MDFIKNRNPIKYFMLIQSALTTAVLFGLQLSDVQTAAVLNFANIALMVLFNTDVVSSAQNAEQVTTALYTEPPGGKTMPSTLVTEPLEIKVVPKE